MKKWIYLIAAVLLSAACSKKVTGDFHGSKFNPKGAEPVASVVNMMEGKDSVEAKLTGKVNKACQVKGCWMTMDIGEGKEMQVRFKDYGFFVPKDAGGSTATIDGWAYRKVIPVDELRHYAQDEGKSEEEINAITEPEEKIVFIANGVLLE